MHCPYCRHGDSRVLDSRVSDDGSAIRRRRMCPECERRFSTVEQMQLTVLKRSGVTEPFNRDKVVAGVRKACKGRPVSDDELARLGQQVEDALRADGWAEVPAHQVGLAILRPLRVLDEVAYLRFASVYRAFESCEDFEEAIADLRSTRTGSSAPHLLQADQTSPMPVSSGAG
jgi:transcriptional repressor NrdR